MSSIQNSLLTNYIVMDDVHIQDVLCIERNSYNYPWSEKIFSDCIKNNYLCRILALDNELIGYLICSIIQDECHIMNLCIKSDFRRLGYARLILNELHSELRKLKCKIVFLECRSSNERALKLYYAEGYNEIGVRKNYYPAPDGYEDATILAKNVDW